MWCRCLLMTFESSASRDRDRNSGSEDERAVFDRCLRQLIVFRTAEGNFGKLQIDQYRALHDFSFPEAAQYLSDDMREFLLSEPNFETYHLQVTWKLFQ